MMNCGETCGPVGLAVPQSVKGSKMSKIAPMAPRSLAKSLRARLTRLRDDEDGAILIFSLQIFLIMLITTGVAIDFVRQEERRATIQATLDRAVLAAADLNQSLDPTEVVLDYFAKSGLGHIKVTPIVKEGAYKEWRSVEAKVSDTMPTLFGPLVGITELQVPAASRATESVGNVEISLVVDISGSMNDAVKKANGSTTTRIALLKEAAKEFVDTMFTSVQPPGAAPGKLSISLVPYNQQVVLGSRLASLYNLETDHSSNTCADLQTLSFDDLAISPAAGLQRTMYGDSFDYKGNSWALPQLVNVNNCQEAGFAEVMAFGNVQKDLKDKIDALVAGGDTAIDFGAKWGLALLDPSARPALDKMIEKGWASADLSGRPFDYQKANPLPEDVDVMKVLVLMTDGQNTRSYSTKPEYRSGPSGLVSTRNATDIGPGISKQYLYYHDPSRARPYYSFYDNSWKYAYQVSGTKYPITYETLWTKRHPIYDRYGRKTGEAPMTMQHVVWEYLGVPNNNRSALYDKMAHQSEFGDKDTDLRALCAKANANTHKIKVFTIAVDAPDEGEAVLSDCATNESYYYPVNSADLSTAFASIASAINALRLTN